MIQGLTRRARVQNTSNGTLRASCFRLLCQLLLGGLPLPLPLLLLLLFLESLNVLEHRFLTFVYHRAEPVQSLDIFAQGTLEGLRSCARATNHLVHKAAGDGPESASHPSGPWSQAGEGFLRGLHAGLRDLSYTAGLWSAPTFCGVE